MREDKYIKHVAEASYKNVIKNKSHTDNNLAWYEEPKTVSPKVDAKSIWLDSEYIPDSPEGLAWKGNFYFAGINLSSVAVVEKFTTELSKVNERAVFYSDKLVDAIQNENYHLQIFDATGEEIPFGLKKWTIDIGVGYLSFTDGMPKYEQPLTVTGYRYCGRKLPEHMITTDGSQKMLPEYKPTENQHVATKLYVDTELEKIDVEVNKMVPPTPPTFENKDLKFVCEKEFSATDIRTMTEYEHIIMPNDVFTIDIPAFYNPGYGTVKLLVCINSVWNEVGRIELLPKNSMATNLTIDYEGEAYPESLSARGFFKKIKAHFTSTINAMSSVISSHINPMKFKMSYAHNSDVHYSNEITICEEFEQRINTLSGEHIVLATDKNTFGYRYVSGIVTPKAGSIITASSLNYVTLNKFTKGTHIAKLSAFGIDYEDFPEMPYTTYTPALEIKKDMLIPEGLYQEETIVTANTYNIFNQINGEHTTEYLFRIDTISDESNRVLSGEEKNNKIEDALLPWDPKKDLRENKELQLLGGKYQWPTINFAKNGTGYISSGIFSDVSWIKTGLDYSICSKLGERFVTFKYDMSIANGIFINFENAENISSDKETHAFSVNSMYIKVDGETDWLDAKKPYDGIGRNTEWMQGCLAVQDSIDGKIYCTFGPKPIEGTLYIRIGIKYDQNIKFSGLTIKENI